MRLVRSLLVAASLVTLIAVCLDVRAEGAAPHGLDVLVVAGQSNALGYQSYVVDPRTHLNVFTDASRSPADRLVRLTWDETGVPSNGRNPVALDAPQVRGGTTRIFGPEVGLARSLYADGRRNLLIVKVAMSGSSLARDWLPGDDDFKALLLKVSSTMAWARANGWTPSVGAFYWFQGETDAMGEATAAHYGSNLRVFLSAVRGALGLGPRGPVVVAQTDLGDFIHFEQVHHLCPTRSCTAEWSWNDEVMRAQAASAGPSTFVVSTATLPRFEDFIHLTDVGELALGRAFATLSNALLP